MYASANRLTHTSQFIMQYGCVQMLDGIEGIDWHRLNHAYGPADDVPELLRSLTSPNEKTREDSIRKLFGNIWHQGTVYEATIYAVPFLIELLTSKETRCKSGVACLLASIVNGYGFLEVHTQSKFLELQWRAILKKRRQKPGKRNGE